MEPGTASKDIVVEEALFAWRRGAVNVFLTAAAFVCLPGIVLVIAGKGPPIAWPIKALLVTAYATLFAGALLRHVHHTWRLGAFLGVAYILAFIGGIALPLGPFVRVLPISLPAAALVLIGARAGRIAALASAVTLLLAPSLRAVPGLLPLLVDDPVAESLPQGMVATQGIGLTAILLSLMILLERFQAFLKQALNAERLAAAGLEQEVAERIAANRELEREMQERHRLEREIDRVGDEERRRLGQEVHDGVCQQLTGALLRCQALERRIQRGSAPDLQEVNALSCLLEGAIDDAYDVSRGICPIGPHPNALASALRVLVKRTRGAIPVECHFTSTGDVRVPDPEMARHLYRIAQEALSNAIRHARAGRISMELRGGRDDLVLAVEDDGSGLPAELPAGGMGMRTMAYRAEVLGGTLVVEGSAKGGTHVTCRIPRKPLARQNGRSHSSEGATNRKGAAADGS